jgi:bifunctional enzyme CysN/CysC
LCPAAPAGGPRRDPHRLYSRARAGELTGLTGVDAPYEPPADPDVILHGGDEPAERSARRLIELLAAFTARS